MSNVNRRITPSITERWHLVAGEFRRDASYTNWRPHGSNDWLLIFTVSGSGFLVSPQARATTRPGEAILYRPGEMQDYATDRKAGNWHLLWVHFSPRALWESWLRWHRGEHGVMSVFLEAGETREGFIAAMRRVIRFSGRGLPNSIDFATAALEEALLWSRLAASTPGWTRIDSRIRVALEHLAANIKSPFSMSELSRRCGLSISRLAHLFKDEMGVSPQQFFERQRLERAVQLLRMTGLTVAEVGQEVGYNDPFYFSNRFLRYFGKRPSQVRHEIKRKSN